MCACVYAHEPYVRTRDLGTLGTRLFELPKVLISLGWHRVGSVPTAVPSGYRKEHKPLILRSISQYAKRDRVRLVPSSSRSRPEFGLPNKIGGGYAASLLRTGLRGAGDGGPGDFSGAGGPGAAIGRIPAGAARPGGELVALEAGKRGREDRIKGFQALSAAAVVAVARAPSHGAGQAIENMGEGGQRRLIANLTDVSSGALPGVGERGRRRGAKSCGGSPAGGSPGRSIGQGGLPPFDPTAPSTTVAQAGPGISEIGLEGSEASPAQALSDLSRCPNRAVGTRKIPSGKMGSGPGAVSAFPANGVGGPGETARARKARSAAAERRTGASGREVHRRFSLPCLGAKLQGYAGGHGRVNGG